jgi:heavy metal sensor kinase
MRSRLRELLHRLRIFLKSIRFQLTLWAAGTLAIILVAFSAFIYVRQAQSMVYEAQSQLQLKSQQLEGLYRMSVQGESDADHPLPPSLASRGGVMLPDNMTLAVVAPDGQTLQTAGNIDSAEVSQIFTAWQTRGQPNQPAFSPTPLSLPGFASARDSVIYLVTPLFAERRWIGLIILGRPVDPNGQLPRLLVTLLVGSLGILALILAGGYWLVGTALYPIRTITRTARAIGESDLRRRLNLKREDELGELAGTFDQMLDRLQAAFDRQRQFTADASHELRTPLTIVGLETDRALEKQRSPQEYESALQVIRSENEFMSHLVNELLTLARLDSGQIALKSEALDLSDLTLEVMERLAPLARHKQVGLYTGELPETPIHGDRQYLTLMITNLVENAIKYSPEKQGAVQVNTGTRLENGATRAWLRVEDNGPGIRAENLPHLFDRFYRVDKARARDADEGQPDGVGLGLAIVQWVARAHQGEVSVSSQVGEGTTFEVRLPASTNSPPSPDPFPRFGGRGRGMGPAQYNALYAHWNHLSPF